MPDIDKSLDEYDYHRQIICDYFGEKDISCYPILYTDVYWRFKGEKWVEFDHDKPEGDPNNKYYLKYTEPFYEKREMEKYTAIKLRDEGWSVFDNKKKV